MCKMYFYVLNVWDRRLTLYWYLLPIQTESARFKICEILQTLCYDGGGLGEFSVFLGLWLCLTLRCCHCGTVLGDEFWPSFFYNHKIVYVNQPLCAIDRRTLTQPHAHPQESILQLQVVTRLEWAFSIQPFLLYYVIHVVLILGSIFLSVTSITKGRRFVLKQGQPQPHIHSKARITVKGSTQRLSSVRPLEVSLWIQLTPPY